MTEPTSPSPAGDSARPPLRLYEWCAVAGGVAYLSLPLLIVFPSLFPMLAQVPPLEGNRLGQIASLIAMVSPLAFVYFYGVYNRMITLADLAIFWRVFWVAPWLVATWATGAIELTGALFIIGIDIGLSIVAIAFDPRGRGFLGRLKAHFSRFERKPTNIVPVVESILGFAFVIGCTVQALRAPDQLYVESFVISLIGCHYFYIAWSAFETNPSGAVMTVLMRFVVLGCLLVARAMGFHHDITDLFAVLMGLGAFFHGYTILWERVRAAGNTNSQWLIGWSIALFGLSALWAAQIPRMTGGGAELANNIHRQDLIIGSFALVVGVLLTEVEAKSLRSANVLSWLLPFSALWFTSESKMLCHLNVGTPLHPSWHARGLAPVWGGSPLIDVTFSFATIFMTVLSTTVTVTLLARTLSRDGWRLVTINGLFIILGTAYWMIMVSSGIPAFTESMDALTTLHPPFPVDPIQAVAIHVRDLIMGTLLIAGGIILSKTHPTFTKPRALLIGAAWLLFIFPKALAHYHHLQAHA